MFCVRYFQFGFVWDFVFSRRALTDTWIVLPHLCVAIKRECNLLCHATTLQMQRSACSREAVSTAAYFTASLWQLWPISSSHEYELNSEFQVISTYFNLIIIQSLMWFSYLASTHLAVSTLHQFQSAMRKQKINMFIYFALTHLNCICARACCVLWSRWECERCLRWCIQRSDTEMNILMEQVQMFI